MSSSSSAASARPSPGLIERSTGRSVAVRDRVGGPDRPGYEKGPLRARSAMPPGVELLKPITWFAPMWAFGCGVVSSGVPVTDRWWAVLLGVVLAGPMVCGASQAANDWFDRHVDTINEPDRPIPSGRLPGRRGLHIAVAWTLLSLLVAAPLGRWGFGAAIVGLILAWAVQCATIPAETEWMVGQRRLCRLLRGVALDYRSRRHGDHPTRLEHPDHGRVVQCGSTRDHDAERLQVS